MPGEYNIFKTDVLKYYNAENHAHKGMKWFNAKLKTYGYNVKNGLNCFCLENKDGQWRLWMKKKGTCVKAIRIPNLEISNECRLE